MDEYEIQQARLELYQKLAEAEVAEAHGDNGIDHRDAINMLRLRIDEIKF